MIKKIIIGIILIITFLGLLIGLFVLYSYPSETLNTISPSLPLSEKAKSAKQNSEIQTELSFTAIQESTVYDLMAKLRTEGKINFTEKTYIGMGKLITAINGIKSNGEKTWIYYVNGLEAEIGVSNYKINPGDVVSWKYEKVHY